MGVGAGLGAQSFPSCSATTMDLHSSGDVDASLLLVSSCLDGCMVMGICGWQGAVHREGHWSLTIAG